MKLKDADPRKLAIARTVRRRAMRKRDFLCDGTDSTLQCMCAIVSTALSEAFFRAGYFDAIVVQGYYKSKSWVHGDDHCWVQCDKEIWDLTASQFGDKKIVITDVGDARYINGKSSSLDDWPEDQQPTPEKIQQLVAL